MTEVLAFLVGVFTDVFDLFTDMLPTEYIAVFLGLFAAGLVTNRLIKPYIAQYNHKGGD